MSEPLISKDSQISSKSSINGEGDHSSEILSQATNKSKKRFLKRVFG